MAHDKNVAAAAADAIATANAAAATAAETTATAGDATATAAAATAEHKNVDEPASQADAKADAPEDLPPREIDGSTLSQLTGKMSNEQVENLRKLFDAMDANKDG